MLTHASPALALSGCRTPAILSCFPCSTPFLCVYCRLAVSVCRTVLLSMLIVLRNLIEDPFSARRVRFPQQFNTPSAPFARSKQGSNVERMGSTRLFLNLLDIVSLGSAYSREAIQPPELRLIVRPTSTERGSLLKRPTRAGGLI